VISVADGQALTQTQAGHPLISGAEFRKAGDGTLVLTAANPLTGPTSIAAGSLLLTNPAALAASASIEVAAGATLDVRPLAGGFAVNAGQTLGGAGTVSGAVIVGPGATLSPGTREAGPVVGPATVAGRSSAPAVVSVPEPTALGFIASGLACLGLTTIARRARRLPRDHECTDGRTTAAQPVPPPRARYGAPSTARFRRCACGGVVDAPILSVGCAGGFRTSLRR